MKDKPPFKLVVLLSGRGSNFEALHKKLCRAKPNSRHREISIVAVISDKRKARGLALAESLGIPALHCPRDVKDQTAEEYYAKLAKTTKQFSPDLIALAGFMRVLNSEFVSEFPGKIVNIHPSLLPSFRGLNAQAQALSAGVRFSGCTVHYVAKEVDAGPIIGQVAVPVFSSDTGQSLSDRILAQEHRLYPAVVRAIAEGEVTYDGSKLVIAGDGHFLPLD